MDESGEESEGYLLWRRSRHLLQSTKSHVEDAYLTAILMDLKACLVSF